MTPNADTATDHQLMIRVAEGDVAAFNAIYRRYHGQAFVQALRLTRGPRAAEEVTQDAFMSLWRSARRYDPSRASLSTWLLSLVRNRGIDALRRGARHERNVELDQTISEHLQAVERTDEQVVEREQSRHMQRLLTGLPSEQREVIQLAYFNGLSHMEIAKRIDIPLGTVKGRQRLGLAKLRRALRGEPGERAASRSRAVAHA